MLKRTSPRREQIAQFVNGSATTPTVLASIGEWLVTCTARTIISHCCIPPNNSPSSTRFGGLEREREAFGEWSAAARN